MLLNDKQTNSAAKFQEAFDSLVQTAQACSATDASSLTTGGKKGAKDKKEKTSKKKGSKGKGAEREDAQIEHGKDKDDRATVLLPPHIARQVCLFGG